jgi:hypothetical protein
MASKIAEFQTQIDEVRTKLTELDRDPKALAELARTHLTAGLDTFSTVANKRIDVLQKETNKRITAFQTVANKRVDEFQVDLNAVPTQVQTRLTELQAELLAVPSKLQDRVTSLVGRGQREDVAADPEVEIIRDETSPQA